MPDFDGNIRINPLPDALTITASGGNVFTYCAEESTPFTVSIWNTASGTTVSGTLPIVSQPYNPSTRLPFLSNKDAMNYAKNFITNRFINPPTPNVVTSGTNN
jgi:hypothetical protein